MANVVPRGRFCQPAKVLRDMLAACEGVQSLFAAADATAAAQRIHLFEKHAPARPFIVVWPQNWAARDIAGGSRIGYRAAGLLAFLIEFGLVREGIEVTAQVSGEQFTAAELAGHADDHFAGVELQIDSGAQEGQTGVVETFDGVTGEIVLASALPGAPGLGSVFQLRPADVEDAYIWGLNLLGDIREDLEALSGGGGYLGLRNIRLDDNFGVTKDEKSQEQVFVAQVLADFGV
jgi:hypothetical protein